MCSVFYDDMRQGWGKEEGLTLNCIFILVTHGRLIYELNKEIVELEKGDLLFIPQGMLRSGRDTEGGTHQKYSAHFNIQDEEALPLQNTAIFRKLKTLHYDYLKQRFSILAQKWFSQSPYQKTICQGILIEMLGYLAMESQEEAISPIKLRLMKKVQDYILMHYRKSIRITELAGLVDRAPNYVTQTYKEVFGITPITYLHQVRVQTARDLILNTSMTISEIAEYLGYSDQAHFNRMFKKIMGCSPSQTARHTPV